MEEKEKHQECLQCVSLSSCKGGDDTAALLWQNRLRRSLFLCLLALISRPVKLESRLWALTQLPGTCRSRKLALFSQSRLTHFFLPSIKNVLQRAHSADCWVSSQVLCFFHVNGVSARHMATHRRLHLLASLSA